MGFTRIIWSRIDHLFVPIPLSWMIALRLVLMALATNLGLSVGSRAPARAAERSENVVQTRPLTFYIPAQPLASALEAYGEATGIEVFYDAALAAAHWSRGANGSFSPARGLDVLLRGTGYAQRATGPGTISIVPAPQQTIQQTVASKRAFERYGPFFAALQAHLSRVLCRDDHAKAGSGEIIFKFWLATSGVITRADIVASGGDPERDRMIAKRVEGLDVGEPPPEGLPEPVTMTVFPPAEGETVGCSTSHDGGGEH